MQPVLLLTMLPPVAITVAVGFAIRTSGPEGFVHGFGDLSRLDPNQRTRIGRTVGNFMFGLATLIAAFAIFSFFFADNPIVLASGAAILVTVLGAVVICLTRYLAQATKPANESRRGR